MNIENVKRDPRKAGNICNKFQLNLKLPFLTGPGPGEVWSIFGSRHGPLNVTRVGYLGGL